MTGDALLNAWDETLARRASDAAVLDTRRAVLRTFGDIEREADQIANCSLTNLDVGSVVAIQLGNHPAWPAALLACLRRELVAVPLERTITEQERETALEICHAGALITDAGADVSITSRAAQPPEWGERVPVLLKLTSGTTAAPRAIRFRSEQLLADCEQICDTMGITERD